MLLEQEKGQQQRQTSAKGRWRPGSCILYTASYLLYLLSPSSSHSPVLSFSDPSERRDMRKSRKNRTLSPISPIRRRRWNSYAIASFWPDGPFYIATSFRGPFRYHGPDRSSTRWCFFFITARRTPIRQVSTSLKILGCCQRFIVHCLLVLTSICLPRSNYTLGWG